MSINRIADVTAGVLLARIIGAIVAPFLPVLAFLAFFAFAGFFLLLCHVIAFVRAAVGF